MRRIGADEVAEVRSLTDQCFRRTVPVGWVWLRFRNIAEHKACSIQCFFVEQGGPVSKAAVAVVDCRIEVVHWIYT